MTDFQQELALINSEIALEDEAAEVSEQLEIGDIVDRIRQTRGDAYAEAFKHGFETGYMFRVEKEYLRSEAIHQKYDQLRNQVSMST